MPKNTSLRLSEKENILLEELKKAYNISNTSELLRVLIRKDYNNLKAYEGINNLSDKQIFKMSLYTNDTTKNRRKEG